MSHTPGPWIWSDGHNSLYSTTPPAEMILDSAPYEGMWLAFNDHTEGNASLIAAAPVMYEYIKSSASAGCATAKKILESITGEA